MVVHHHYYDHCRILIAQIHRVHKHIRENNTKRAQEILLRLVKVIRGKHYDSIVLDSEVSILIHWCLVHHKDIQK